MYEAYRIESVHRRTGKDLLHVDFMSPPDGRARVLHPERDPLVAVDLELGVLGESFEVSEQDAEAHFTPSQRREYERLLVAYLEQVANESPRPQLPRPVRAFWASNRLTFIKRFIDPLAPGECFAIAVNGGPIYVMSRTEFESDFCNVVESRAYAEYGSYNYKDTPAKAAPYVFERHATDSSGPTKLGDSVNELSARQNGANILSEDDVVLAVRAHLEARGWSVLSHALAVERGDDLVALRDGVRVEIEAKGEGSSKPSSNRFGHVFTSNQVNDHVGRAILRALKVLASGKARAAVAFPDNADHRREIDAVRKVLDRLELGVFLVGADKKVSSAPEWA